MVDSVVQLGGNTGLLEQVCDVADLRHRVDNPPAPNRGNSMDNAEIGLRCMRNATVDCKPLSRHWRSCDKLGFRACRNCASNYPNRAWPTGRASDRDVVPTPNKRSCHHARHAAIEPRLEVARRGRAGALAAPLPWRTRRAPRRVPPLACIGAARRNFATAAAR